MDKLLPVLTLILGSLLTYYFGLKAKRDEALQKSKEEQYSKLLVKLKGFSGNTANGQLKEEFFEEQYKSWLYSSDSVVVAINNMVNHMINHQDNPTDESRIEGQKNIGKIVVAMREDLRGKTKLKHESFKYTDVL